MQKIAVIYGSSTGNTKAVAQTIAKKLIGFDVTLADVADFDPALIDNFSYLILGTSTWGYGDLQDDWESFLPKLQKANLDGKTVALFGVGDSESYSDTFVNGMGTIYEAISSKQCRIIGKTSAERYDFDESAAVVDDMFVGLALDEDNCSDLTEPRVNAWIEQLKNEF